MICLLCAAQAGVAQASAPVHKQLKPVRILAPAGIATAPGAQGTVCFARDGRQIVAGWQTDVARIIAIPGGEVTTRFAPEVLRPDWDVRAASDVAFAPDGKTILTGSTYAGPVAQLNDLDVGKWDYSAHLWDVATGREVRRFQGHTDRVGSAAFSPDGRRIVTGSYDHTVRVWDTATGQELSRLTGRKSKAYVARFSPDGRQVASGGTVSGGSEDGLLLHDVDRAEPVWHALAGWAVSDVAYSPDGRLLVIASSRASAQVWVCSTKKLVAELDPLESPVNVEFIGDGKELVITGQRRDRTPDGSVARVGLIRIYDCSTWTLKAEAPAGFVGDLTVSPDGAYIVTGTSHGLELWSYDKPE
jgi:WD40 repeat protein